MSTADATASFHEQVRGGRRVLSYSQLADWSQCRHRWFLKYGLGIHPIVTPGPLQLGDMAHRAIAGVLSNERTDLAVHIGEMYQAMVNEFDVADFGTDLRERFWSQAEQAIGLARRALAVIEEQGWTTYQTDGKPGVELSLSLPIDGFESFDVHIDWLAHDHNTSRVWLTDFKFRGSFSPSGYEQVNLQHLIYAYVASQHGIPITGTCTFEVKNELPAPPKRNKNGEMSRVYSGNWSTYRDALLEAGLNPSMYGDMEVKLQTNRDHQLLFEYRSRESLEQVWNRIVLPAAAEIAEVYRQIDAGVLPSFIWRNLRHFGCQGCPVRPVCLGSLNGWDVAPIVEAMSYNPERVKIALAKGWLTT